ncbi:hypothetical protein METBIDRAFT_79157 [Metschnikowia bicuspidata var. bicuspidata NRRL YB-4993]|uniref:RRM domain-containing protein n=1 Tax=Metschnikowia bicuspidata var. bicuspidata NRRL YB-4993 TaxID=869754 RepID=A0A1A0H753_9ASCO|nr:hypothetical protein METBIDRAFT_79157 [Metschnikowia bicuspidata var. bicuspidata NRRL YB-4993]OBA19800.1 hypothetical protein METBIDRAFT_79157 [Metschnikowia bicuspidata var. bicuspidata NRRL YB-4993]
MPQNTLYVTGFTRETKAADLAPDFEKYGELVRLDIPPPRSVDGEKFAFVEYKNSEDCEKALEIDGKSFPYALKDGLTVQLARSDPISSRRGFRGGLGGRGGYSGRGAGYMGRGGRGGYGYPSPYAPPRGGRGGYGYQNYGYERGGYGSGGYGGGYPSYPSRGGHDASYGSREPGYGGREPGYGGGDPAYGGRDASYGSAYPGYGGYAPAPYRDSYGYRGYDDYRAPGADDRDYGYLSRDKYHNPDRRRGADRNYDSSDRHALEGTHDSRDSDTRAFPSNEPEEYGRGRYSRSNSPKRDKSRSRSPSR